MKTAEPTLLEPIELPFDEAGRRCCEVLVQIALKRLRGAREAADAFVKRSIPGAEVIDEKAMVGGKYAATLALPNGSNKTITYDYLTKAIELI